MVFSEMVVNDCLICCECMKTSFSQVFLSSSVCLVVLVELQNAIVCQTAQPLPKCNAYSSDRVRVLSDFSIFSAKV